jgi:hypothetical protein
MPGGTIAMFRLFARAFSGEKVPLFTARKCVKEETATSSRPHFQRYGTNEHTRTIAVVAAAGSPRPAAFPLRPRQDG